MKRFNLHIGAFLTLALAVSSCAEEELVKDYFVPSPSSTITFGASDLQIEVLSRSEKSENAILSSTESKLFSEDGKYSMPMLVQVQEGIHRIGEAAPASRGYKMEDIGDITTLHAWATHNAASLYINGTAGDVFAENGNIYSPATEGIHYMWPSDGTLDFMTVANKPATFTPNFNDANTEIVSFNYTVPANAADQPDILIAQASAKADAGEGENPFGVSVPLDFKHIMAAVNVKVGALEVDGTINSVSIKGVWDKATYVLADNDWIKQTGTTLGTDGRPVGTDYKIFEGNFEMIEGEQINSLENTLMMIPQTLPSGAEVEISITDPNQNVHILRASIQGDKWSPNTTTNYLINIDGSYNMQIVALDKLLDSHYIMTKVEVSVTDINNWVLEVSSQLEGENTNEPTGTVTIQPESLVNPMAKQGYWTDKLVRPVTTGTGDNTTVSYEPIEGSTARGTNTYEGSGDLENEVFYVFIPENISGKTRNITVTLKQTTGGTAEKVLPLKQQPIKWISPNGSTTPDATFLGAELLLENGLVPWGFNWDGLVETYTVDKGGNNKVPPGWIDHVEKAMANAGIDYANFPEFLYMVTRANNGDKNGDGYYEYIDENGITVKSFNLILRIDYSTLVQSVDIGTSDEEGLTNTWSMYNFGETEGGASVGIGLIDALKTFINSYPELDYTVGSSEVNLSAGDTYAALNALKRNKFNYYADETFGIYLPIIDESDVNWYLPAKTQFTGTIANTYWGQDFKWSDYYWTSTIVSNEANPDADTGQAYIFNNGAVLPEDRTVNHQVMAVRRYTNDVIINSADIVQSGTGATDQEQP